MSVVGGGLGGDGGDGRGILKHEGRHLLSLEGGLVVVVGALSGVGSMIPIVACICSGEECGQTRGGVGLMDQQRQGDGG